MDELYIDMAGMGQMVRQQLGLDQVSTRAVMHQLFGYELDDDLNLGDVVMRLLDYCDKSYDRNNFQLATLYLMLLAFGDEILTVNTDNYTMSVAGHYRLSHSL